MAPYPDSYTPIRVAPVWHLSASTCLQPGRAVPLTVPVLDRHSDVLLLMLDSVKINIHSQGAYQW